MSVLKSSRTGAAVLELSLVVLAVLLAQRIEDNTTTGNCWRSWHKKYAES